MAKKAKVSSLVEGLALVGTVLFGYGAKQISREIKGTKRILSRVEKSIKEAKKKQREERRKERAKARKTKKKGKKRSKK